MREAHIQFVRGHKRQIRETQQRGTLFKKGRGQRRQNARVVDGSREAEGEEEQGTKVAEVMPGVDWTP